MPISFSIDDLLTYTDWDRTKWHEWFREQGPKALAVDLGANNNGNIHNVGQLVRHIFAAEKRYVERCLKTTLTDPTSISAEDVEAMFAFGVTGRQALRDLLASFTEWEALREMQFSPTNIRIVTPRKMILQTLTHELRHWAQVAAFLRQAGYKPGSHDLIGSPLFDLPS
ncbi:MAG TPA: hypothetical protein DCQ83_06280 [Fibrobacteres bacterium]|jgi:uncharacterized damage-inducible protein DinB|nr:hypothetical protein [Fibrobacterota bacterium]